MNYYRFKTNKQTKVLTNRAKQAQVLCSVKYSGNLSVFHNTSERSSTAGEKREAKDVLTLKGKEFSGPLMYVYIYICIYVYFSQDKTLEQILLIVKPLEYRRLKSLKALLLN